MVSFVSKVVFTGVLSAQGMWSHFITFWCCSQYISLFVVATTAQDLLEQWAAEKLDFSDAYVDTDHLEIPTNTTAQTSKTAAEIKREWDHLTEVEIDDTLSSVCDTERKGHSSQNSKRHKNNGRKTVNQSVIY